MEDMLIWTFARKEETPAKVKWLNIDFSNPGLLSAKVKASINR